MPTRFATHRKSMNVEGIYDQRLSNEEKLFVKISANRKLKLFSDYENIILIKNMII